VPSNPSGYCLQQEKQACIQVHHTNFQSSDAQYFLTQCLYTHTNSSSNESWYSSHFNPSGYVVCSNEHFAGGICLIVPSIHLLHLAQDVSQKKAHLEKHKQHKQHMSNESKQRRSLKIDICRMHATLKQSCRVFQTARLLIRRVCT